jgi:hypothetical protein
MLTTAVVRGPRRQEALLAAVVHTILPPFPPLPPVERTAVTADVVATVVEQISAMPSFLRVPYRGALVAFDLLSVLRFGRPFRGLDDRHQRAWLETWGERGVGPMRAVVKLVRSCTLFAWFDHPRVGSALDAAATH